MKFLILFCTIIFSLSCSRHGEWLVKTNKSELPQGESFEPPFVARFKKDNRSIYYIVSKHLSIQTRETIRQTVLKYPPETLVIDGVEAFKDELPENVRAKVAECEKVAFKGSTCGETAYALREALARKMKIMTGEPRDQDMREYLLKAGYEDLDIIAFFLHRQLVRWIKLGITDDKKLEANLETQLLRWSKEFELKQPWPMQAFIKWRMETAKIHLALRETQESDIAPNDSESATFLQKMATKAEVFTDRTIIQTITRAHETSKTTLVVLDAHHYYTQLEALIDLFGAPLEYKL